MIASPGWYRVEIDERGRVCSCTLVEASEESGTARVYFVRAEDERAAEKLAYKRHEAHRMRLLRERYAAEGKCRCGRSREKEAPEQRARARCPHCLSYARNYDKDSVRKRAAGVLPPAQPKSVAFQARQVERELELLDDVQRAFRELTMRNFGLWLQSEIDRRKHADKDNAA